MYKNKIELKKACMAFKLENGEILLISKEDINQIAHELVVEMMINNQNHVHIHKSSTNEKCQILYKAITEQPNMSKTMLNKYLGKIVDLIDKEETTIKTIKKSIEDGEKTLAK